MSLFLRNVFWRTLLDQRRALLGYGLGLALLVLFTGAFYPTIRDQAADFQQLAENLPKAVQAFAGDISDLTSAEGYLRARLYALVVPALLLAYAITKGSDVIGGEEDRGTLDILLAQPITRTRTYLQKAAAVAGGLTLLGLVVLGGVLLIDVGFAMGVPGTHVLAATVAAWLLALAHGALALGLTGLGWRRGAAAGTAAAVAVVGYLLNAFAQLVDWLEPLRPLSPFTHFAGPDPIKNGFDVPSLAILAAITLVPAAVGWWRFRLRDIAV